MTGTADRSGGRPTLEAVAARAGVSRGTVSRVVNNSPKVSPEARAAVLRAVEELGYVPNHAARTLVTRRTNTVALVVSESEERVFTEPYFAGMVRGISAGLAAGGSQLLLAMAQSADERERLEQYLAGGHVDGVLMISQHDRDTLPAAVEAAGVPFVLGGRPSGGVVRSYVDADNVGGARLAVAHLVAQGRRRIATITGPSDMQSGVDRLAGYRVGLTEAGLPNDDTLCREGDFSQDSGAAGMSELLARRPDIDAVFAASDPMAVGAMRVLKAQGRRVPEDVAVVGFDDSVIARHADPPLTTVYQPLEAMGKQMAVMLLAQLRGERPHPVLFPTHLVVRASA